MKKTEFLKEIKALSKEDLASKASAISEELMKLRFRKVSGQVDKSHRFRELSKNLARVKTQLNAIKN